MSVGLFSMLVKRLKSEQVKNKEGDQWDGPGEAGDKSEWEDTYGEGTNEQGGVK